MRKPDTATYLIPHAEACCHRVEVKGRALGVTRVVVQAQPDAAARICLYGRPVRDGTVVGPESPLTVEVVTARYICRALGINVPTS